MVPESSNEVLKKAKMPALLVTDFTNIRYMTGLQLSAGVLLVLPRAFILFVDGRYRQAADAIASSRMKVRDIEDIQKVMKEVKECGYESDKVTVYRKSLWKQIFPNTKFVQCSGIIEEFRRQKDDKELKLLRRAQRMTHELLRRIPSALRTKITEEKLARQLQIWALELGADGLSFDPIVAFGTNTSSPHHHPTNRSLKKGHIVQIDVGAKYKGYCADASQVFFTGKPTAAQKKVYKALVAAQKKAFSLLKPGVTNHALDKAARDVLQKAKIDEAFTHALGHGVGLEIHEGVTLSQRAPSQKLLKGEVITLEPGVYFAGKFGMRIEDIFIV